MRRIASGGMAEVWMGRRRAMGGASKTVAIKLLAPHLASKPIYQRMFVDEARLTMMLTHSNIVQVFDVGAHEGQSYLVMEWVDGLDLSRLVTSLHERGQSFELHVVAHVIGEVLRGLAYAHGLTEGDESSAIVHRDISPHNVLISVSGEVKVSDFGVARLAAEETSGVHVRGKLRYMPPEQLRGDSRHPTTDLFAVGAMMQELLDGVRFRAGCERDELIAQVIAGEVPPLERLGVPTELRALRDGLLARDREARIQSADAALELLRRWPGYRNATDELADLVRGRSGVTAPRTGLDVDASDEVSQAPFGGPQTQVSGHIPVPRGSVATKRPRSGRTRAKCTAAGGAKMVLEPKDEPTVREGGLVTLDDSSVDDSGLATRLLEVRAASERAAPAIRSGDARARARSAWSTALGVALSVVLLAAGLGLARASWTGSEATASAAPTLEAPSPSPELIPVATIPPAAPEEAEPAPGEKAKPATGSVRRDRRTSSNPAHVEFAAHEFFFVWIKIDGRKYALEPVAKIDLPPGRHKVWLRESASEPWVSAGRIEVRAGKRYRVNLEKPGRIRVRAG